METAYICDAIRTPFGRYGGALASIRTDDLAAIPLKALVERNPTVDWNAVDDVVYGCANQAGEDNRNVARMALLLAGLPKEVPGTTVNRLCGSSMDAVATAAPNAARPRAPVIWNVGCDGGTPLGELRGSDSNWPERALVRTPVRPASPAPVRLSVRAGGSRADRSRPPWSEARSRCPSDS